VTLQEEAGVVSFSEGGGDWCRSWMRSVEQKGKGYRVVTRVEKEGVLLKEVPHV